MDKFVTVKKPTTLRMNAKDDKNGKPDRQKYRYNPYGVSSSKERKFEDWKDRKRTEKILAPLRKDEQSKPSSAVVTKHLLNSLGDTSNPITHSTIYERSDHISSAATGHQRSEGRGPPQPYIKARHRKLAAQLPEKESQVLRGVKVYINGYLDNTTDIEMKRIVTLAGGQVQHTASGATHVLTSQQLSGAKTHKLLTSKSKHLVHVVRPEWVTESIDAGRRLSEREYSVVKNEAVAKITDMFGAGSSSKTTNGM